MSLREVEIREEVKGLTKDLNKFTNGFYLGSKFNWTNEVTSTVQEANQLVKENNDRIALKELRQSLINFCTTKTLFFILIKQGIFKTFIEEFESIEMKDIKGLLDNYNPKYLGSNVEPEQLENLMLKRNEELEEMKDSLIKAFNYTNWLNYGDIGATKIDFEKALNSFKEQMKEQEENKEIDKQATNSFFGF